MSEPAFGGVRSASSSPALRDSAPALCFSRRLNGSAVIAREVGGTTTLQAGDPVAIYALAYNSGRDFVVVTDTRRQ